MKGYLENMKNQIKKFWEDESGIGTVELILILVDNPFTSSTYILSY